MFLACLLLKLQSTYFASETMPIKRAPRLPYLLVREEDRTQWIRQVLVEKKKSCESAAEFVDQLLRSGFEGGIGNSFRTYNINLCIPQICLRWRCQAKEEEQRRLEYHELKGWETEGWETEVRSQRGPLADQQSIQNLLVWLTENKLSKRQKTSKLSD